MKVKIVKNKISATKSNISEKSVKSLAEWKIKNEENEKKGEFERSFDSVGSNIKIINGSFSTLKPMNDQKTKDGEKETALSSDNIEPNTSGFKPTVTSTPTINKYEDISDAGEPEENDNTEDISSDISEDVTFNYQEDVIIERESCEKYLNDLVQFITKTQDMVQAKLVKRAVLLKKIKKYQKKIKKLETSLTDTDRMITFGTSIPKLLDNV